MKKAIVIIIVIFITLCGAFLRLYNLGELNFNGDELNHVYAAKGLITQNEPILPSGRSYDRASLYSYLVALSFEILGESEFTARIPSALFSIFIIPLIYLFSRYILEDELVGIFAAILFAFDPWSTIMARFSRMYTMFAFLFLVLLILFYKGVKSVVTDAHKRKNNSAFIVCGFKWPYLIGVVLLFPLTFKIHKLAFSCVLVPGFYLFYILTEHYLKKEKGKKEISSRYLVPFIVTSFILILPMLIYSESIFNTIKSTFNYSGNMIGIYSAGISWYFIKLKNYFGWHTWSLAFIGGIYMFVSRKEKNILLALSFFIPLIVLSVPQAKNFRYIYHLLPFFLILISFSIINLFKWLISVIIDGKHKEKSTMIAVFVVIFALLWFLKGIMFHWKDSFDITFKGRNLGVIDWPYFDGKSWEEIADFLRKNATQNDWIATSYGLETLYYVGKSDFHVPEHGWNKKAFAFEDGENLRSSYDGAVVLVNRSNLEEIMERNRKIWIIVNTPILKKNKYKYDNFEGFLDRNLKLRFETSEKLFRVYEWD